MSSLNEFNHDSTAEKLMKVQKKSKLIRIVLIIFCIILVISVVGFITVLYFVHRPPQINNNEMFQAMTFLNTSENNDTKLVIIPRAGWLAQSPEHPAEPLRLPVPYVIILHTATENCTDQAKCIAIVRYIQTYHMESKGWWDIGYNFIIGGDGYVYEGRGWKGQGAHVVGWNSKSIGITFIGSFNRILPPNRQILACKQLIEKGVNEGYVSKNYKLLAQRQLSSTQSPGEVLYENIKTWPHWTEKP